MKAPKFVVNAKFYVDSTSAIAMAEIEAHKTYRRSSANFIETNSFVTYFNGPNDGGPTNKGFSL